MTLDNRNKIFFQYDDLENSFEESIGIIEGDFKDHYIEFEILGEVVLLGNRGDCKAMSAS